MGSGILLRMRIVISITYSEIFEGDVPNLKDLLIDIPSEVVVTILSLINSQLYLDHSLKTQVRILDFLTLRQSDQIKTKIFSRLIKRSEKEPSVELFTPLYTTEFIHYELLNFKDFHITDTSPEQELNLIKAYFLIVEQVNARYSAAYKASRNLDADNFQKMTWPTLIDQFDVNHNTNPITGMVKGLTLLNYLEFHSSFSTYVQTFIKKNQKEKIWNYILDLANLVKSSWDAQRENPSKLLPFSFNESSEFSSLFENFAISIEKYAKEFSLDKRNFSGLKDKPLFKSKKQNYIVLNWNFLSNKLYDGLLYDFFNQSGISDNELFKSFLDFKKFISKEVIERYLFKKLIENCFKKKHLTLLFDDEKNKGFPDAYVRDGKYIYLIEIKDAFFPASSVNSLSYYEIKKTIDQKYNSEKKGTGQIVKQIEKLKTSSLESKTFDQLKLKRRNLRIYPIMIYTDNFFNLPGINQYLKNEFKNKINEKLLDREFGKIEDLTFINLSYLIDNIHLLSESKSTLKKLIDQYHQRIRVMEKKYDREKSIDTILSLNDPFMSVMSNKYSTETRTSKDYIETIFKVLKLTENLD